MHTGLARQRLLAMQSAWLVHGSCNRQNGWFGPRLYSSEPAGHALAGGGSQ
jgi:hypothetical protein